MLAEYRRTAEVQVRSTGKWQWNRPRNIGILEMAKVGNSVSETVESEKNSSGRTGKCCLLFAGWASINGTIDDLAVFDGVERDARVSDLEAHDKFGDSLDEVFRLLTQVGVVNCMRY